MRSLLYASTILALALGSGTAAAAAKLPPYIAAAAANPARGNAATVDARRHGPELLAFAGVKPGDKVLDLIPGSGYFTRLISLTVGPRGHVYGMWPAPYAREAVPNVNDLTALGKQPGWRNISVMVQPANRFSAPEPLDVVFTSQNYHDYSAAFMGKPGQAVFNQGVYRALKPGGVFIVIDHVAQIGSGLRDTDTLHRIDPQIVIRQARAAGFMFEGESRILRNPKDAHKVAVFDKSIRGNTDQFVFRFRKPRR
ncbi:MAG: class I SAM-dependent methyltransferase [Caulobacteraceae bacterium]